METHENAQAAAAPLPQRVSELTSPLSAFDIFFINFRVSIYLIVTAVPVFFTVIPVPDWLLLVSFGLGLFSFYQLIRIITTVWPAAARLRYKGKLVADTQNKRWVSRGLLLKPFGRYAGFRQMLKAELAALPVNSEAVELAVFDVEVAADGAYSLRLVAREKVSDRTLPSATPPTA